VKSINYSRVEGWGGMWVFITDELGCCRSTTQSTLPSALFDIYLHQSLCTYTYPLPLPSRVHIYRSNSPLPPGYECLSLTPSLQGTYRSNSLIPLLQRTYTSASPLPVHCIDIYLYFVCLPLYLLM